MFSSSVLEVAIGLVLVYLLLSLVCSAVNEFIGRLLAWRSTTLEAGIKTMLDDLRDGQGASVGNKILDSPLIRGLKGKGKAWTGADLKPTYVPSRAFALALLEVVSPSSSIVPHTFDTVRNTVGALPDSEMKKSLLALLDSAAGDLRKARENIERWFDETMDQVSAWYRRTANTWLFIVAVLVCAFMNADSVAIATSLWRDPSFRAAVVAAAEKEAKNARQDLLSQATTANVSAPATQQAGTNSKPAAGPSNPQTNQLESHISQVQELGIPMGWTTEALKRFFSSQKWTESLEKIIGILFTAIAVSLGAPFWFDMLNKLVNFRAAGNKPEKTTAREPTPTPPPQLQIAVASPNPPAPTTGGTPTPPAT